MRYSPLMLTKLETFLETRKLIEDSGLTNEEKLHVAREMGVRIRRENMTPDEAFFRTVLELVSKRRQVA